MSNVGAQEGLPKEAGRHFLLKLNADDCLSGKPQPQSASDWEDSCFRSKNPRATRHRKKLPFHQRKAPVQGDNLLIWINSHTGGLTATARVSSCEKHGTTRLRIRVENVGLLPPRRVDDGTLQGKTLPRVLEDIREDRRSQLRFLSSAAFEELNARAGSQSAETFQQEADEEVSRRERLGKIYSRPAQVEFSRRLRSLYRKCAVTGCTTQQSLEAAHIRVHERKHVGDRTTSKNDDNNLENGILLRADIHALFDKGSIALSQDGTQIEVKDNDLLTDKTYRFLGSGRVFRPSHCPPSRRNITSHRRRFGFPCD
jgi:hypothetical protein